MTFTWDAEAWFPCDSAPQRCSAPDTMTLPVPGVLICLWWVVEQRVGLCPTVYSCTELYTGQTLETEADLEEEEGISGRETLFSEFCLQR